jgi:hypothetical protein
LPIAVRSTFSLEGVEFVASIETVMHDFLVGLVFVAMVMTPCVVALTVKRHDADSK